MDNLQKFITQVRGRLFAVLVLNNLIIFGDWYIMHKLFELEGMVLLITLFCASIISLTILPWFTTRYITEPTKLIWQAILHIAPDAVNTPAPDIKKHGLGHDLVVNLVSHIYQLASVVETVEKTAAGRPTDFKKNFVANSLPLPLMVLDKKQDILFANKPMLDIIKRTEAETTGQNVYSVLDLSFGSAETLDKWLASAEASQAVATKMWERVRLATTVGETVPQFDLAAYYNKGNPDGFETMLVLFDKTKSYSQDDQGLSFVALAVHELRTPITLLRGYIEALEEDLEGKLDAETLGFIHKMKASAQTLTGFINNMLNVARIENDQLVLKLQEDKWADIVQGVISDEMLRAKVQGVELITQIDPNLPTVGVDRVSAYEVLANLVDNAIKYSGKSKKVYIKSFINQDGMVETTVQDAGVGIPTSVLPNLFEKFYRSHRSRNQVGGTGLGLYLAKSFVEAHGGHIWVRSKENVGTTFGFTVIPFSKLADEKKTGDNNDITRGAHGWIKNHSLYSR
ncbi:MAG TPA: PAS domain-containing sensor histidine kinase [Candidatus Saccharimonadales bacterium]|jgi:signal transduction histidine kinase|nr:PAS domain-containing sensor histidine kinase [Candidatus Saccharimonadales bacterium]